MTGGASATESTQNEITNTESGNTWQEEIIDTGGNIKEGDLKLDSKNKPQLIFFRQNHDLIYAYKDSEGWQEEYITNSGGGAYDLNHGSLAIDSQDQPHICYFDYNTHTVNYVTRNGAGWKIEVADGDYFKGYSRGTFCKIALDSKNNPHLIYLDEIWGKIIYTSRKEGIWNKEDVTGAGFSPWYAYSGFSLTIDSADNPHFIFVSMGGSSEFPLWILNYGHWNGSQWTVQPVDEHGGGPISLATDSLNTPHISYGGSERQYAIWDEPGWIIEPVYYWNGGTTSLAVDSQDHPHITFQCGDGANTGLKYANKNETEWVVENVNSNGIGYCYLDLDSLDKAHISATINGNLYYYSWVGSTPPVVDKVDPVNNATNVAVDKIIRVYFSKDIKAGSNYDGISLKNGNGDPVLITKSLDDNILSITSKNPLTSLTTYTLTLPVNSIRDMADNSFNTEFTSKFTTFDTTPLTIKSTDPAKGAVNVPSNKKIKINFNKDIKKGNMFIELKNSAGKSMPITCTLSGKVLEIKPDNLLSEDKFTVCLHTGCVTDLAGNKLALNSTYFTTDCTPPTVKSTTPVKGSIKFSKNATIYLKFSENIKTSTNWNKITVKNLTTGKTVSFSKSLSGTIISIKTIQNRVQNNYYQVYLPSSAVKDYAGNQTRSYTLKFRSG